MTGVHAGTCFCGAVAIQAAGAPLEMGYCHCGSCRAYSGAPVTTFTLWRKAKVKVTRGGAFLGHFAKTEMSHRRFCTLCGGHVMVEHPSLGCVDIHAATLPTLKFAPSVHLNYAATVLPMKDGLPKLADFPAHAGGSGAMLAE